MSNPFDALPDEVKTYLDGYQTRLLNPTQAEALLPELRRLVAAVPPTSRQDAKVLMSSACRFLAEVSRNRDGDLAGLLTDVEVARWSHVQKAGSMSDGTLANHLGRLQRLLRVRRGLPGRIAVRGESCPPEPPYSPGEVAALVAAGFGAGDGAGAVVVALLGAGVAIPDSVGSRLGVEDGRLRCVTADGTLRTVVAAVAALTPSQSASSTTTDDWQLARQAADEAGLTLSVNRGRQTWRVLSLCEDRPVADIMRATGIGAKALDATRPHLPAVPASTVDALLRG